jgi:ABC-type polysaccharide/polyol phosphate transport system ATPase subunit
VGDAHFHKKSFSKVMELKQKGITIILVSHNLPSITEICNKVIWLEKGKIVKIGENVKEIVKQYQEKSI